MTFRQRSIRTEFRVLAIDTCNNKGPIGVVYRGGLYLDGVLLFGQRSKPPSQIGEDIRESKYFPELQILMFHDSSNSIDLESVQKETELPLLTISMRRPRRSYQSFQTHLGRIWINTLLDPATVQRILKLTWTMGRMPEPVRVAHLLARSIRFSAVDKVKDKSRSGSLAY